MRTTLEEMRKLLDKNPGKLFYRWFTPASEELVRIERVFLNVVRKDSEYRFMRLPNQQLRHEHRIVFAAGELYRILNGPRRGWLVKLSAIQNDEKFVRAGVRKKLHVDRHAEYFSYQRKGDRQTIGLLEDLLNSCEDSDGLNHPDLYLTCPPESNGVNPRSIGSCAEYITSMPGYDDALGLEDNLKNLKGKIAKPGPEGRLCYPYALFCGRGTIAADTKTFGQWFGVAEEKFFLDEDHLKIGDNQ